MKYGKGCEKSLELAVDLFLKSSEQGNIKAFCNLAICYEEGTGVEKNLKTAIAYYRKAANQGDKFAEEKLMKLEQNK